jgi:predicted translin family RNA/ssDNA-binding protein
VVAGWVFTRYSWGTHMKITAYLKQLRRTYQATALARRKLVELSAQAQHLSKQAIFTAQRGELVEARQLLASAVSLLKQGQALCRKVGELEYLGSYRASLEEFVEAELFTSYLATGKLVRVTQFTVAPEVYLGGLSDMLGELVRYAVKLATVGKRAEVDRLAELVTQVVGELAAMNMTGSLRSKFDQAKQHLRRLEDIRYDLSVRRHA